MAIEEHNEIDKFIIGWVNKIGTLHMCADDLMYIIWIMWGMEGGFTVLWHIHHDDPFEALKFGIPSELYKHTTTLIIP